MKTQTQCAAWLDHSLRTAHQGVHIKLIDDETARINCDRAISLHLVLSSSLISRHLCFAPILDSLAVGIYAGASVSFPVLIS